MKGLIRLFLPLCIFSFIAFGISTAVLGVNRGSATSEIEAAVEGTLSSEAYATISEEFDRISVTANACRIMLLPGDGEKADVYVSDSSDSSVKINARVRGGTLEVYDEWDWDWLGWLERLFEGDFIQTGLAEVTVFVPDKVYEHLDVTVNAGEIYSYGIGAYVADLDLSAGDLEYTQPETMTASAINIDVAAGSLRAYNAAAEEYHIDVSAGSAEVYGLTGNGDIAVSAGSARAQFAELNGSCDVDVSAGEAVLDIPENSSVRINCDKSAGDVVIDACGMSKSVGDGETVTIGGGRYEIDADISAGNIYIVNSEASATTVVDEVVISGHEAEHHFELGDVAIDEDGGVVSEVPEAPQAPSAPKAPEAPEAPEAPAA